MGLITDNAYNYYAGSQNFIGDGSTVDFVIDLSPQPTDELDFYVYIDDDLQAESTYSYTDNILTFATAPADNVQIIVTLKEKVYGDYRYISLNDIVTNFIIGYVGDGKIINRAKRRDVVFHTKRALQEFSYDITKVEKIQEMEVGPSLSIPMPQDYVNYVAISFVDNYGIERPIPRGTITSKPSEAILQDEQFNYQFDSDDNLATTSPLTDDRFKNLDYKNVAGSFTDDNYFYNSDYPAEKMLEVGKRYGGEPSLMNNNGFFIIDEKNGTINFTSNLHGKLITIKYISDSMGTDDEMKVHKFAEEAIYKHVAHAILSSMAQVPEYIVNRFRRERRASMRNAKLRLYDLKLPELTQVMRGRSKQIKH
jgi:hypothetical protein